MNRRHWLKFGSAAGTWTVGAWAGLCRTGLARAQGAFPTKPVRLLVGYPPGGPNDAMARAIAQVLGETFKQPVVVENRAGAAGIVATEVVARSPADGYVLTYTSITHAIQGGLYPKLPYDVVADFTPISLTASAALVLIVHPSVQAKNAGELVELIKSQPRTFSFASTGNGTSIHIYGEMFKRLTGTDVLHVPFNGSAPAMTALLGGQVQMMVEAMPSALPQIKAGKVRPLAIAASTRSVDLPDVPTFVEAGLPSMDALIWWGVLAPKGMPAPLVKDLNTAINDAVKTPAVRERMLALGVEPRGTSAEDFDKTIRSDVERFTKIIKEAGIKVD